MLYNEISGVSSKSFVALEVLTKLDLSFNAIKKMNTSMFEGLENLETLILQKLSNQTIEIESISFLGLDKLQTLDLSYNHIALIQIGTFDGLNGLSSIALSGLTEAQ